MSGILGIATSGLLSTQQALDTIANNIANASTKGYNRQTVVSGSRPSVSIGAGYIGTGVEIQSVRRVIDEFVIQSMSVQQSSYSQVEVYSAFAEQLDNVLADPATGIAEGLNQFFTALQDLANDPSSVPARQLFISQAQILQNRFNEIDRQLVGQFQDVTSLMQQNVTDLNRIAKNIAEINTNIVTAGGGDVSKAPNDLLDKREELIQELSKFVSVTTSKQEDGAINVFIGNGQPLVIAGTPTTIGTKPNLADARFADITIVNSSASQVITDSINGGTLGGLLKVRQDILAKTQNSINRLGIVIAQSLNKQHQSGVDLNGDIGGLLFNDPNDITVKLDRVIANKNNLGTATLSVAIEDTVTQDKPPYSIFGINSNLVDTTSLNPLLTNGISINGINIRPTQASDDTLSSSDNTASSIALANAINSQSSQHGVTASALVNQVYLGSFTNGALLANEFQINGIDVISTGVDVATIVDDINALYVQTGVEAKLDNNNNVTLVAQDGRNIQLRSNTNTPTADFSNFNIASGTALNKVQRSEVKLSSNQTIDLKGTQLASFGLVAQTYPSVNTGINTSDYLLKFDGSIYSLTDLSNDQVVKLTNTPNFSINGFSIKLEAGTINANDEFIISPTRNGAVLFETKITNPNKIALSLPVIATEDPLNTGNADIKITNVTNTTGSPQATADMLGNAFEVPNKLSPPIRIEFVNDTTFRIFDISNNIPGVQLGADQTYNAANGEQQIFPIFIENKNGVGPNNNYLYDPGYKVVISGDAKAGDVFNINYNQDSTGDNRNALNMLELQNAKLFSNGSSTYQESYSQIVGEVGIEASQAKINLQANESLLRSVEAKRNSVSGVNLDEEAASLLKYEQAYQAAAQIILIARSTFDTLIRSFGG